MTVRELILELTKFKPTAEITLWDAESELEWKITELYLPIDDEKAQNPDEVIIEMEEA